jgi:hypothetical protein
MECTLNFFFLNNESEKLEGPVCNFECRNLQVNVGQTLSTVEKVRRRRPEVARRPTGVRDLGAAGPGGGEAGTGPPERTDNKMHA